ncbi:MAG: tetratricopeptide repeat protein [Planctomycetes bacterium]|nr:tetratricopeptide repeat protein [Planctomycetota bacterium]
MDFSKHLQKADEAMRRRQWDFAIEVYQQLLALDADLADARGGLRRALKRKFEEQKSSKLFRAALGAMPLGAAKTLLKTKRYDAAAKQLESYLTSNPLDVEGNLLLGQALEGAGFFKSARAVYEFVAEIAPSNSEGLKRAGAMMQKSGDVLKALEYYERALRADPRDQEALKARKDLSAEAALAKTSFESVQHSRDLIKDKDRAQSLERERRRHLTEDELKAELDRATARFTDAPNDVDLMVQLGELHEKLGDYEAAAEFVDRAASYRKESYELAAKAGDLQSKALKKSMARADKAGDAEKAARLERELAEHEVRDWRRRTAMRPNELPLRFELGKRLMRTGELDTALAEFQRVLPEPRLQRDVRFWLGQCFQAKGFLDLAKKEYAKALEQGSGVDERAKEILYNLGAIAEAEGDLASARGHYARVYEIDIGYRDVAAKMERLK